MSAQEEALKIDFFSVLQGLDEISCIGLKHLFLGAVHKCHGNMNDCIQVYIFIINQNTF